MMSYLAKPTKANTHNLNRNPDEMMHRNFTDYGTLNRFLGVIGSDFAYPPWRPTFLFDAIVSDPPYGIRESSQHISRRQGTQDGDDSSLIRDKYDLTSIYVDLLNFANIYLRIGGRLVFWMPTHIVTYDERLLPTHPCFQLIANDEQQLNRTVSRRLLTMIKIRHGENDEKAQVNEKLFSNFRDLYFTSNTKIWEQMNQSSSMKDSSEMFS
jgi:tRNA (guanine10-N2)-methyltransferase